jgi:hypothetical protein
MLNPYINIPNNCIDNKSAKNTDITVFFLLLWLTYVVRGDIV